MNKLSFKQAIILRSSDLPFDIICNHKAVSVTDFCEGYYKQCYHCPHVRIQEKNFCRLYFRLSLNIFFPNEISEKMNLSIDKFLSKVNSGKFPPFQYLLKDSGSIIWKKEDILNYLSNDNKNKKQKEKRERIEIDVNRGIDITQIDNFNPIPVI